MSHNSPHIQNGIKKKKKNSKKKQTKKLVIDHRPKYKTFRRKSFDLELGEDYLAMTLKKHNL